MIEELAGSRSIVQVMMVGLMVRLIQDTGKSQWVSCKCGKLYRQTWIVPAEVEGIKWKTTTARYYLATDALFKAPDDTQQTNVPEVGICMDSSLRGDGVPS
ncbi:hypothetical protein PGT21_003739 [Puccinia graminis f. sp. tritici]|uniref:Uncharacterized protein n=1 Tax=Puccinia graminis f. sp. tritici TaxID=56615 RepID=A0A5B0MVG3_PUCGR|nr:hypothetical protein PGTUg99_018558 [Puccinia graminis f. sp. tritici]KAA1103892.1 hypothetical protein PGT21_003739 [Puccinia graminis f. sp. tritici]